MARLLLVDDDTAGLAIRKLLLEHAGHQVVAVSDRSAALAQCAGDFDTAILDLRLPELQDGLALLRELRCAHDGLRLIVLCGDRSDLDGRPERDLADEIFSKPVRPGKLLAAVTMKSA